MAHVSITRLHLASLWSFPMFMGYSLAVARQARRTAGFKGGWLGTDAERGFWTCTVWESVDAMRAFRNNGVHRKAMPKLLHWADEASLTHWQQPDDLVPSPEAAYAHLAEGGVLSKLHRPSAQQLAGLRVGRARPRIGQRLTAISSTAATLP